jgi:hypothetical protein
MVKSAHAWNFFFPQRLFRLTNRFHTLMCCTNSLSALSLGFLVRNKSECHWFSGCLYSGGNLEAKCRGPAPERINAALSLLFLVMLLPLIDEGFTAREHEVHHAGQLVGHRGVRAWRLCQLVATESERRKGAHPSESAGRISGDFGEFAPGDESCHELFAIE